MKINCRNCGYPVADWEAVKAAAQAKYNYSDAELDAFIVLVFHPDCAIADGRADPGDEFPDGFYWVVRLPR